MTTEYFTRALDRAVVEVRLCWVHIRVALALRVGPKSSSTQTKLSEHETNRGEVEKSERVSGEIFEILGQPAAAIKPSESAFDNPTSRQKLEPFARSERLTISICRCGRILAEAF